MRSILRAGLIGVGVLVALAIGAVVFVGSGVYNIGADDHHTKIVLTIIEQLRDRSIAARSRTITVPVIDSPEKVGAGAQRYAALQRKGGLTGPGNSVQEIELSRN